MENRLNGFSLFYTCRVDATSAWDAEPDAGCRCRQKMSKIPGLVWRF